MGGFLQRLRRHQMVQWAAAYTGASFALIQVFDVVAQRFGWSDLIEKLVILALAVGFFVVLVLAWYHGERGAQRVGGTELLIVALLLAIGGSVLWMYARSPATAPLVATIAKSARPASAASAPSLLSAGTTKIPEKSIAVLPFVNGGGTTEQFLSDGLSQDLINALSQFEGLKVISRNSAFQFRNSKHTAAQIGKALGVAHLLEGTVQRAGEKVRITATLVNAADGSTLWSQHYDRPYQDLFTLQDEITHSVASGLQAKLLTAPGAVIQSNRPPSGNLAAFTAYQHSKAYSALGTEAGARRAIEALNEAIRLDPKYAVAYALLSVKWVRMAGMFLHDATDIARAKAAAYAASDTALQLGPDSSWVHVSRAFLLSELEMDWTGAEVELRRALQLAPNDASAKFMLGEALSRLGQNQRALGLLRAAVINDPRYSDYQYVLGGRLIARGRLDEARQATETAIALQPGVARFHAQLVEIEILRGDARAALTAAGQAAPGTVWREIALALALQIGSNPAAADAALAKLVKGYSHDAGYQIAQVYALRKDPDAVFKWLDNAWASRDSGVDSLLFDPFILRYRNDPRFAAFAKKVGLPTTTDAVAMK